LLLRLRDLQDKEAWELFTQTYAPLVYSSCRRQGLQEADAADVSQEVLTQIARSIEAFDYRPERGRFRDWLGAVVRSKVGRFRRKQRGAAPGTGTDNKAAAADAVAASPIDTEWADEFNAHIVKTALTRIRAIWDATHWRAFEMLWLEDRPGAEVARMLGISASAAYVAKWRILRRLREEVETLAEDVPHLVPLGAY
jgi:RNA polymerase sigma-70 factor (ECF subfamily)